MIGGGSLHIDGCRALVHGRGIDPAAVRDVVRATVGAPMVPPDTDSMTEILEWSEHGVVVRDPIWTEAGRSSLQIVITAEPEYFDGVSGRFWRLFVSGVLDAQGHDVLTPAEAPAPTSQPYPPWTEERDGQRAGDPRIPRGAFAGYSYGLRFGQLLDGMYRVYPDVVEALDRLNEGQAAIVMLHAFFGNLYGDGIDAAYQRLAVDGGPRRLVESAELVGATAYAEVFEELARSLPPLVRDEFVGLRTYLEDLEDAALDADDRSPFWDYEDRLFQLEDDGDVIWQHMARYVEQRPDQFFTPE